MLCNPRSSPPLRSPLPQKSKKEKESKKEKKKKDLGNLPRGWRQDLDDEGTPCYTSPEGDVQWEDRKYSYSPDRRLRPRIPRLTNLLPLATLLPAARKELPEGWSLDRDADGDVYFYMPNGDTTWDDPRY